MEPTKRIVRENDPFRVQRPLVAGGYPMHPPKSWFDDPHFTEPTPLTVTADGQVYGHIATWSSRHIGRPDQVNPPRSRSNYAYFRTGVVRTAEGDDVPVGQLTLGGGHAPISAGAEEAVRHYDDTGTAVADLAAGEDPYGVWVAGGLRPDVDDLKVRALRASAPSGDWRPISGSLELVGILQVNVPGFPTARALVAGGEVMALVAAGVSDMYMLKYQRLDDTLHSRVGELEATVASLTATTKDTLRSRVKGVVAAGGKPWADKGGDTDAKGTKKRPNTTQGEDSYPIPDVEHLKKAVQAYGRAKNKDKVKRHIISRAKELGATDLLPDDWDKS